MMNLNDIEVRPFTILLLLVLLFPVLFSSVYGQNNGTANMIHVQVVDKDGNPVPDAEITSLNGKIKLQANQKGELTIQEKDSKNYIIKAYGYESVVRNFDKTDSHKIILPALSPSRNSNAKIDLPFGSLEKEFTVGAIATIDGEELSSYPTMSLENALVGKAPGLYVFENSGTPGWNSPSLYIRGLSRNRSNGPIVIVDGIERSLNELVPEEIESIQILKDATSKMLYGAKAGNGVILVKTKRGNSNQDNINISFDYGIKAPTALPEYLNSYQYAKLYNEARTNDGLDPYYSQQDLKGYKNHSDDILYPDVDFYDRFLNNYMPYARINTQFEGGSNNTQYFVNLGYTGEGGLESVGETTKYNRLNLRANIDFDLNSFISMYVDAVGRMEFRRWPNMSSQNFFNKLSHHRPNEYPIFVEKNAVLDSAKYGGSQLHSDNVYGLLASSGYNSQMTRTGQMSGGVNLNLSDILQGLKAKAIMTFDTNNYIRYGKNENFASYQPFVANDSLQLIKLRSVRKQDNQIEKANDMNRKFGFFGILSYKKSFGDDNLSADFVYFRNKSELLGHSQDTKNENYGLRLNYAFNHKYIVETDVSYMGSSKFAQGHRFGLFPSFGIGWIISEEPFLRDSRAIDYLKFKSSIGVLGYDGAMGFRLYQTRWNHTGGVSFGPNNGNGYTKKSFGWVGNPSLGWEKSREFNAGIEGTAFQNSIHLNINYFNIYRYDILTQLNATYPAYEGRLLRTVNYGATKMSGIDGQITYNNFKGAFNYSLGLNATYSTSENVKIDELNHQYSYLQRKGQPIDAMFGYVAEGLYQSQKEIDDRGVSNTFGEVQPGDIRYKDLNDDGVIDKNDRKVIGNWFPKLNLGLTLNLGYKRFGLYALGVANIGDGTFTNNSYYWNYGERKYSTAAENRWTPSTANTATYPRLTTQSSSHNFRNSTYWYVNTSYFKLKNAEFSYSLPENIFGANHFSKIKVFIRGTNLFSFSKVKNMDPEDVNAGINNFPIFRTITGGMKASF